MVACIDEFKDRFRVGPVRGVPAASLDCGFITPRGCRMFKSGPVSCMAARHEALARDILETHADSFMAVYGYRKTHAQLLARGWDPAEIGRDQVMNVMRESGIRGVRRGRTPVTTKPAKGTGGRPDLVERGFEAEAPNRLHVADITYVRMANGSFGYTAFVTDVFARRIVGWACATTMDTREPPLQALEQAISWAASHGGTDGLVHHSDHGAQYIGLVYTTRVGEFGMLPSAGTVGDSYGNAMAGGADGACKTELVWRRKPFRDLRDLESATFRWVSWRGLEASAPVLGPQDTGTDRNRVLCKPSGASRPTIRAEQKSGHINESRVLALRQWGMAALYGSGDVSDLTLWPVDFRIGAIWFLLALFWARLLLHFFAKLPYTFIWVIACFLVGYGSSRYVWLPWSIQAGMCAVAFLYLGYLAKKYDVLDFVRRVPYIWIIAFLIWIIDIVFFDGMSMAMNSYGPHPILAVVGSIAGTLCVIGISQLFDKVAVLGDTFSRIGQASLAILCAHLIEDDVLLQSWQSYLDMLRTLFPQVPLVLLSFIVRLPIDFAGAALLHYIPKINEWFYPQLAKQHQLNRAGIVHKRAFPLEK